MTTARELQARGSMSNLRALGVRLGVQYHSISGERSLEGRTLLSLFYALPGCFNGGNTLSQYMVIGPRLVLVATTRLRSALPRTVRAVREIRIRCVYGVDM